MFFIFHKSKDMAPVILQNCLSIDIMCSVNCLFFYFIFTKIFFKGKLDIE